MNVSLEKKAWPTRKGTYRRRPTLLRTRHDGPDKRGGVAQYFADVGLAASPSSDLDDAGNM